MAKKPPIDLQTALAAAKAKLAEPPQRLSSPYREPAPKPNVPKPKVAKPIKAASQNESSLTLEKLAQAWVKTKNFPKNH